MGVQLHHTSATCFPIPWQLRKSRTHLWQVVVILEVDRAEFEYSECWLKRLLNLEIFVFFCNTFAISSLVLAYTKMKFSVWLLVISLVAGLPSLWGFFFGGDWKTKMWPLIDLRHFWPLNGIQCNLPGSKFSKSSTNLEFFIPIKTRYLPRSAIGLDILDFLS